MSRHFLATDCSRCVSITSACYSHPYVLLLHLPPYHCTPYFLIYFSSWTTSMSLTLFPLHTGISHHLHLYPCSSFTIFTSAPISICYSLLTLLWNYLFFVPNPLLFTSYAYLLVLWEYTLTPYHCHIYLLLSYYHTSIHNARIVMYFLFSKTHVLVCLSSLSLFTPCIKVSPSLKY